MTIQRMIELLEIEHECILRNSHDDCDRDCANCDLVQDDGDLHEMYTNVIAVLREQEGVVPYIDIDEAKCPVCKVKLTRQELIGDDVLYEDFFDYCPHCGKPVLWEGR